MLIIVCSFNWDLSPCIYCSRSLILLICDSWDSYPSFILFIFSDKNCFYNSGLLIVLYYSMILLVLCLNVNILPLPLLFPFISLSICCKNENEEDISELSVGIDLISKYSMITLVSSLKKVILSPKLSYLWSSNYLYLSKKCS